MDRFGAREGYSRGTNSKATIALKNTPKPQIKDEGKQPQVVLSGLQQRRCFKCPGLRHIASKCPNRHVVALIEEDYEDNIEKNIEKEIGEKEEKETIY